MSSRGSQRFDLLFEEEEGVECIFDLARNGSWAELVRSVLGVKDLRCQVSVVYSRPGAEAQVCVFVYVGVRVYILFIVSGVVFDVLVSKSVWDVCVCVCVYVCV
jgi:hypothetical protein